MDERLARIAAACLVEPGTPGVAELMEQEGPHAVLDRLRARPARSPGAGRYLPDQVPRMLEEQQDRGARVLVVGDPEFPSQLLDLPEPPLALWVRGAADLRMAALRSVAVVGARACTPYGERATARIGGDLADLGWTVVSGCAFGIDAAAHRVALASGAPTVAVLASGVDVPYPRAHTALLGRIVDEGAVVSEHPPGSVALKHRFLARNRLIAALTRGTVVVEAARRSGALATAHRALELGRQVMAVPGPITSMASSGSNALLHDGLARAVVDGSQVATVVLAAGEGPEAGQSSIDGGAGTGVGAGAPPGARAGAPAAAAPDLPEEVRPVLAALPHRGGREVGEIARRSGVPEPVCLAHLGLLEILGVATRGRNGWRQRD